MISIPRCTEQSSDDNDPTEVPLEATLYAGGGDPYFAIFHNDGSWRWEFHDEQNVVRVESRAWMASLRETVLEIRETQKRMGNLSTPILRVVE